MKRRSLIRLLIGLAIGIPILIEGFTFFELFHQYLGGDTDSTPSPETRTDGASTTPTADQVTQGDELLPETPQSEIVSAAVIEARSDSWPFTLTVTVNNDTDSAYELRLSAVTTSDGRTIGGNATTGRIEPGGSETVSGEWELSPGSTPVGVVVVAITYPEGTGTPQQQSKLVKLGKIPVSGQ
ncbi:MAG: hypothetical protein ABEH65_11035 [Halobacteriales archaeon]